MSVVGREAGKGRKAILEIPITAKQFAADWTAKRILSYELLPVQSDGVRILAETAKGRRNYLISDVTATIVANQGTPAAVANAWPAQVIGSDFGFGTPKWIRSRAIAGEDTLSVNIRGFLTDNNAVPAANNEGVLGFTDTVTNKMRTAKVDTTGRLILDSSSSTVQVIGSGGLNLQQDGSFNLMVAQQGAVISLPIGAALITYSTQITTNVTTTVTAATAYIGALAINTDTIGTTSTVTVQDKQGTPLKLINGLGTAALGAAPTTLNAGGAPFKMTSGIDIVTAGAVAAKVDVWISYWQ